MQGKTLIIGKGKNCTYRSNKTFLFETGHMVNVIDQTDEEEVEVVRAAVGVDLVDETEAEVAVVDSAGADIKTTILEATILRTDSPESVCASRDGT